MTSQAVRIIRDGARNHDAFDVLFTAVVESVVRRCTGADVQTMRRLGGYSHLCAEAVAALSSGADTAVGSKLWPWTLRDELALAVPELRERVQFLVAVAS